MADPNTDPLLESFSDLPILPTGSGVADLEIAYEQMKLAEAVEGEEKPAMTDAENVAAHERAMTPTEGGTDTAESAAHPS